MCKKDSKFCVFMDISVCGFYLDKFPTYRSWEFPHLSSRFSTGKIFIKAFFIQGPEHDNLVASTSSEERKDTRRKGKNTRKDLAEDIFLGSPLLPLILAK